MLPLISIVMATYRPNNDFLIKQLQSLNDQSYPHLELVIRDDSSDTDETLRSVKDIVEKIVTNIPCKIYCNDFNIGSNMTFQRLTLDAAGEYIAYCDQDDIWDSNKILDLYEQIETENAVLAYSDLSIIDEHDDLKFESFRDMRKRLVHLSGEDVSSYLLRRNCVTGCTMLVKRDIAVQAIPFMPGYVHDHWLTLFSSFHGRIAYVKKPLVHYRVHGNNQIGASKLRNIRNKEEYFERRVLSEEKRLLQMKERFITNTKAQNLIDEALHLVKSRKVFYQKRNITSFLKFWRNKRVDQKLFLFETFLFLLPLGAGGHFIELLKKTRY